MKIHTVIRLIDNRLGWWTHWPSQCGVKGHTSSMNCDCQVPKNWFFPFDVHAIYQEMNRGYPY